ncbi:outer membrane protein assembly factor BamD [Granulicella rosea]|uniref:Outer membrane protein assembly factor BamD n=1 Tax=Granulicella rosea TaxID=474952 RepID=A0A239KVH5_9BACT|nr:outer membrane protein assembly factor BamD [Granulicella rosea]SNT21234.1 outer membrane protein assembly factor BamD [Granulicella rosea]
MAAVSFVSTASFFPTRRAGLAASLAIAGLLALSTAARAQDAAPAPAPAAAQAPDAAPQASETLTAPTGKKRKQQKDEKVVQSKDTKKSLQKTRKSDVLAGVDSTLPDKALYDKAIEATKKGHFDVARLDLQTMLNTYPDSQYQMRAKLAIADSWYHEGGTAALTQAESEYADFRVFFPNAPEAAEAQMRIGDIYFRQMDKPDRDYSKATHAEEEYRRMLTDYPNSILVPEAKQKLRDVQEVLATRESEIAAFYSTHENWAATIARYQTVVDTYPQYSHMDDTLIGLGDAYEAEARYIRSLKSLPEAARSQLEQIYDGNAADAYRKVVLDHSAAAHVEDARDRLAAMNLEIPVPSQEQVAASIAMENSRHTYKLTDRLGLFILHRPDTVTSARIGEPTLLDPKPTLAPMVSRKVVADFQAAVNPAMAKPVAAAAPDAAAPPADGSTAVTAPVAPAPLQLNEVPSSDAPTGSSINMTVPAGGGGVDHSNGSGVGGEIITTPATAPATAPAAAPTAYEGLKTVGPANTTSLPAIEKPAEAPSSVNDVAGTKQAEAQKPAANGKNAKPEFDKADESSSKHKKKKGLKKLDPL